MFPKKVWIVFIVIIIVYGFNIQGYEGTKFLLKMNTTPRHVIDYLFLFFFAIVGYLPWLKYPVQWPKKLWVILYSIAILLISLAGIIDFINPVTNLNTRLIISGFRVFFTGPLPYGILMFLISLKKYSVIKN
jgi:hypothetical protein